MKRTGGPHWVKIEAGRCWRYIDETGRILGFVRFTFDGWDGYVCTGAKWPNADKLVTLGAHRRSFWYIRSLTEDAARAGN